MQAPRALIALATWLALTSASAAAERPAGDAALRAAFPAPGATWQAVVQPFWVRHRVFKLTAVADPRWTHRPTVALDAEGVVHHLTDGVLRLPASALLAAFNRIARAGSAATISKPTPRSSSGPTCSPTTTGAWPRPGRRFPRRA